MSARKVTPEERLLWQNVAKTAEKLSLSDTKLGQVYNSSQKSQKKISTPISAFTLGSKAKAVFVKNDVLPHVSDQLRQQPVRMDKKTHAKLSRGKLKPEGRIDLHGMTLDIAKPRLTEFLLNSHSQGRRLVLVITGKGRHSDEEGPIPVRYGILRNAVPQWFTMHPLASVVLQATTAHARHGGHGAYYVYLRRHR